MTTKEIINFNLKYKSFAQHNYCVGILINKTFYDNYSCFHGLKYWGGIIDVSEFCWHGNELL